MEQSPWTGQPSHLPTLLLGHALGYMGWHMASQVPRPRTCLVLHVSH